MYDEAHPYASGQHRGIDIGADAGGSVAAPAAGTISFAGTVPTSGKSVTIETSDGYSVTLTHLGSMAVSKGAAVGEGDTVGAVGPSGTPEVDGPYVHLGIRRTADQNGYLDPLTFLPAATAESPPADSASGAAQPGASGGVTTAAPATQPAPAPASSASAPPASAPVTSMRVSTSQPSHVQRTARAARGSTDTSRPEVQRPRSSQRPAVPSQPSIVHALPTHAARPSRPMSKPVEAPHLPVVEASAPRRPGFDAGQKLPSAQFARRPRVRMKTHAEASADLVSLLCNGAAALVAVTAALVAARRRRRFSRESRIAAVQVLHLPQPALDWHRRQAA